MSSERTDEAPDPRATTRTQTAALRGEEWDLVGTRVDRYEVTARLGAGGMGVVYAAHDTALDRRVALKVLPSLDPTVRLTFEIRLRREAQALAKVDHQHVVRVYDVGAAAENVFVAMQLVDGTTLEEHLATTRPAPRAVIDLFVAAGRGLAAAHAAGIVHRDFKPSNVLVDRGGRVYVSDFGLARGTDDAAPEAGAPSSMLHAAMTRQGAVMGTPFFMAPEQHRGEPATALSDQFSFCLSLWRALFGAHPFGATSSMKTEPVTEAMAREAIIDPPARRGVPARVVRALRRGLRHDPAARWPSLTALLAELAPSSRPGVRLAALGAGGVALGVVVALVAGSRGNDDPCARAADKLEDVWNPAARERVASGLVDTGVPYATDTARRVVDRIDRYATAWTGARIDACRATHVRGEQSDDLLDRRMRCLDGRLAEVAGLIDVLAVAEPAIAERAVRATEDLTELAGCADVESLSALIPLPSDPELRARASALSDQVARVDARMLVNRTDATSEITPLIDAAHELAVPQVEASALQLLAENYFNQDDFEHATATLREAMRYAALAHDDVRIAQIGERIAYMLFSESRYDAALLVVDDALAYAARAGDPPTVVARLEAMRGRVLTYLSRNEEARAAFRRALEIGEKAFGKDHPELVTTLDGYATLLDRIGETGESIEQLQRALDITVAMVGDVHPRTSQIRSNLGGALLTSGDLARARRELEEALAVKRTVFPANAATIANTLQSLAIVASSEARYADAERIFDEAIAIRTAALGPEHQATLGSRYQKAATLAHAGRLDDAIAEHEEVLALKIAKLGPTDAAVANSLAALGDALTAKGEPRRALGYLQRALEIREKNEGGESIDVARSLLPLGEAELLLGDVAAATARSRRALSILDRKPDDDDTLRGLALALRARCAERAGDLADARVALEQAIALPAASTLERNRWQALYLLGDVLWKQGDRVRAVDHVGKARDGYAGTSAASPELTEIDMWLAKHRLR